MEAVQSIQPKKVFVHHNLDNAPFYLNKAISGQNCTVTSEIDDADIIVVAWKVDKKKEAIPFLEGACKQFKSTNKDIIFACVDELRGEYDYSNIQETLARGTWKDAQIAQLEKLRDETGFKHGSQICRASLNVGDAAEFKKVLAHTVTMLDRRRELEKVRADTLAIEDKILADAKEIIRKQKLGEIAELSATQQGILQEASQILQSRQRVADAQIAATQREVAKREVSHRPAVQSASAVQPASFFGYRFATAEQASIWNSRQERNNYLEENLRFSDDDAPEVKMKKLILLFAHYKSIRHVKSTLSERLEEILAGELLNDAHYQNYIDNRTTDRATIRGKKYDRVALQLEDMLRARATVFHNRNLDCKIDVLVAILDSVDDLERGFFSYKSETGKAQMNGAMRLASNAYDKIIENRRDLDRKEVADLTKELVLPKSAIKAVQKLVPVPSANPLISA